MITLLRNCRLFDPAERGVTDLLIHDERVALVAPQLPAPPEAYGARTVDLDGATVLPGLVDSHVHVLGGGGSGGFGSRGPELELADLVRAGTTTVIGVLGVDGLGRDLVSLLGKVRALRDHGMTAFMLSGAYDVPPPSITGSLKRDIYLIPEVLGIGEIAISDARSSEPTQAELRRLVADAATGGRLAGKPEVVNFHLGPGKAGLEPLFQLLAETDVPVGRVFPTHLNRAPRLLDEAVELARLGGRIDLTGGIGAPGGIAGALDVPEAAAFLLERGVDPARICCSTDGNGVHPHDGLLPRWPVSSLFGSLRRLVVELGWPVAQVVPMATANPAAQYRLFPGKGALRPGSDADLVVLDGDWRVDRVFARGRELVAGGRPVDPPLFPALA